MQPSFEFDKPKIHNVSDFDRRVLAITVYAEARGESHGGRWRVAWTIRNRAERNKWWGEIKLWDEYEYFVKDKIRPHSFAAVCLYKWQYSCWNPSDPNHEMCYDLMTDDDYYNKKLLQDKVFRDCVEIADRIDDAKEQDPVNGATHYYNPNVVTPKWASKLEFIEQCGNHIFMKEN